MDYCVLMTTTTTERPVAVAMGAIVHQLMWEKRISQTAMGEYLGLQQSAVGKKLRGAVAITLDELAVIARVLGEDPGDLVLRACRDSNPKPSDLYLAIACSRCGRPAPESTGLCKSCWLDSALRLIGRCRCCPGSHRQGSPDSRWVLAA